MNQSSISILLAGSLLGSCVFGSSALLAQDISYFKSFGASFGEQGQVVVQLADGSVATGMTLTDPFTGGSPRPGLLLTDETGTKIFCKKYANIGLGSLQHILPVAGGFILIGITSGQTWVVRTDMVGDVLWSQAITIGAGLNVRDVVEVPGGFLLAAVVYPTSSSYPEIACFEMDLTGQVLWVKQTETDNYQLKELKLIKQGGDLFLAGTGKLDLTWLNVFMMRLNATAEPIWTKHFSTSYDVSLADFLVDDSGNFHMIGRYYNLNTQGDIFLLKLNANGDLLASKFFDGTGGNEAARCATMLNNGNMAVSFDHGGSGDRSPAVVSLDPNTYAINWCKSYEYETQFTNYVLDIISTDNSGVIMVGDMHVTGKIRDTYLVRTLADGNAGCYTVNYGLNEIVDAFTSSIVIDSSAFVSFSVTPAAYLAEESAQVVELELCSDISPTAFFNTEPTSLLDCEQSCFAFTDSSSFSPSTWGWSFEGGAPSSYSGQVPPEVCWTENGTYAVTLTVSSPDGANTSTQLISVDLNCDPQIPNVFSPNSDGVNDSFIIDFLPARFQLSVFNRWGQIVFQTSDRGKFWKGKHQGTGNNVSEGVYYYELIDEVGGDRYTGHVQVLR